MRYVNTKRRRKKYARNFSGGIGHDEWIRGCPCLVCETGKQRTRTQAAHVVARGMGGVKGDWKSLVPLCRDHHIELDKRLGRREFESKYGIDLGAWAEKLTREHLHGEGWIFDKEEPPA